MPSSGSSGRSHDPGFQDRDESAMSSRVVITFGTFDVLHIGHLRILERARLLGDHLVVGVSSDELNMRKKQRPPVFDQQQRLELVGALRCVDTTFIEESLEAKADYIRRFNAQALVMGDDWRGRFDEFREMCEVIYLPRTPSISTTATIERIQLPSIARPSGPTGSEEPAGS